MMGGGFFDNMWDPYGGAYAYPRTQPRARYYRPRAPVYEERPAYVQRASVQPENHIPGKVKVEESARKTVRTIPVTDGGVHVEVEAEPVEVKLQPVVRFESDEVAARKIQAVYRGYSVRRTEPLKHLRVIMKVREEFEGFKRRLGDRDVRVRVSGDAQERLRWTEGIMALLLRLDQLQGVHPEVRVFRKAAAKELLMFQENLDSISNSVAEKLSVGADVAEKDVGEEEGELCHAAEERSGSVVSSDINVGAVEAVEKMEVEKDNEGEVNAEDALQIEAEGALANDAPREEMEQDAAPLEESEGAMLVEASHAVANDIEMEQDAPPLEERRDASQVIEAEGALADDAHRETTEHDAASVDEIKDREHTSDGVEGAEISSSETRVPQEEDLSSEDQSGRPSNRTGESIVEDAEQDGLESRVPAGVPMDVEVEAATTAPVRLEDGSPHSAPVIDVDGEVVDRALLKQLLEENRKLKDVVGKVLHWGKQQNDIIHSLASRIEHLEEKLPQANMLPGEQINGRKRICNDGGLGGDRARSQRSKGRRKGGQHNRHQLGYLDSEWLSADSDEYF